MHPAELHARVKAVFRDEPDCPPQRIEAFCKLLDETRVAQYETDRSGRAAALRLKVFTLAGPMHPLVEVRDKLFEHAETEAKQTIARQLGRPTWAQVEPDLFADVFECNRLKQFSGYPSPEALLSRYNVAQVQAALFRATRLRIEARADFQRILTHAKLARLLHDIRRVPAPATPSSWTGRPPSSGSLAATAPTWRSSCPPCSRAAIRGSRPRSGSGAMALPSGSNSLRIPV